MTGPWTSWADAQLDEVRRSGRWRQPRALDGRGAVARLPGGAEVVVFASNDYLGLTDHPAVKAAAVEAIGRWGTGSGSARLIVGARPVHDELEAELAAWKGQEAAIVLPTGFTANLAVLAVVGRAGVTIFSDELNHASIIDGCRLSKADVRIYPHGDLDALDAGLAGVDGPTVVVTDAVFSMDGDVAPLAGIAAICRQRRALLVVDEAHSVLAPDLPLVEGLEVLRVGTMSKTLGSLGGFVATSAAFSQLLVNRARPYIFTTAPTPADTAAALAALRVLRSPEGDSLLERLRRHVERLRPGHASPVLPYLVGSEADALAAAEGLLAEGLLVPAIRPPTVAPGTSRLRVTLSAAHTEDQVERLAHALDRLGLSPVRAVGR